MNYYFDLFCVTLCFWTPYSDMLYGFHMVSNFVTLPRDSPKMVMTKCYKLTGMQLSFPPSPHLSGCRSRERTKRSLRCWSCCLLLVASRQSLLVIVVVVVIIVVVFFFLKAGCTARCHTRTEAHQIYQELQRKCMEQIDMNCDQIRHHCCSQGSSFIIINVMIIMHFIK